MRVAVYFNIRRRVFSVKALAGPDKGRVIHHGRMFALHDVTFKVSAAGRAKVLETGVKNVHAFIIGEWEHGGTSSSGECWRLSGGMRMPHVRYNPRKDASFVRDDGTAIFKARCAELQVGVGPNARPDITVVE